MKTDFISFCVKHYDSVLDDGDKQRLHFFEGLWRVLEDNQAQRSVEELAIPEHDQLVTCYANNTPLFEIAAPCIDTAELVTTLKALTSYITESGMYDSADAQALQNVDWDSLIAQYSPNSYLGNTQEWLSLCGEALYKQKELSLGMTRVALQLLSLALFSFYEPYAEQLMEAVGEDEVIATHPLTCPVCGSDPVLASVGDQTSSDGRGRKLYCQQCGTAWEFNRVRCARCGTTDQTKLHYFNLEGDDNHRIATCDECGEYIRTTFLDNNLLPLSYPVEDVVMARLDALAQDSRFRTLQIESREENEEY